MPLVLVTPFKEAVILYPVETLLVVILVLPSKTFIVVVAKSKA